MPFLTPPVYILNIIAPSFIGMARGHMHRNIKRAAERAERALAAFNDPIPPLPRSERSAAQDVYQIGELRRRILSFCGAGDLIGFMRAEKGCMRDVARVIYYSVKVSKFEGVLSENEVSASA